jgi:lactose/cellobiose-specific phosphotransferase system IIC component
LTIPILLIGSFCVVFLNLPVPAYQDLIAEFPLFTDFLLAVHFVTLGVFSLYVAFSISVSYTQVYAEKHGDFFTQGAPFAAVGSYLALVGIGSENFAISVLSTRSLFVAIFASLLATVIYCRIIHRPTRYHRTYSSAADSFFNRALTAVFPVIIVVLTATAINSAISFAFGVDSFEELFFIGISSFFPADTDSLGSGILYLFLNNLMWFFGIHGGNMLDGVAQDIFLPGTALNAELIAAGESATHVITKTSLDVFASIGGAGALLSLLLAVLIFGRHRNMKKLSGYAAAPMVFNISEVMLFGLPVIWNPTMIIPFILVPIVNIVITYFAMTLGLVPYVTVETSWITPPIFGGYFATGSIAGAVLQAVCLVVGMFIYLPFLRLYEKTLEMSEKNEYQGLLSRFQEAEFDRGNLVLTTLPGTLGLLVRALSEDLRRAINEKNFDLYYQPQFDINDKGVGAEALLRWNHPVHGMMYPPLIVRLAEEIGMIEELESAVLEKALEDAQQAQRIANAGMIDKKFAISVNSTARALQNVSFVNKAISGVEERNLDSGRLVIEATEHDALTLNKTTTSLLTKLVDAGIPLAIDDFSMGHTSFKYLETSTFSIVKLDGSIARGVMENARYAEIVSAITRLSEQLNFLVLAEYVETREQRDLLHELGCTYFQGYLYSPAVPFEEMLEIVKIDEKSKMKA